MKRINCISINHKHAPIDIREQIRIRPGDLHSIMGKESEAYTLNTCSRTEVYWIAIDREAIYDLLARLSGIDSETIKNVSQFFTGRAAIKHLFMVSSGLDSFIIGESQILGQVKVAYREVLDFNTASIILNKALHQSFRVSKLVHSQTQIGMYSVSVASEAVELASQVFGEIDSCNALVIGAGDMASKTAKRLKDRGVKTLTIMNRTYEAANDLARELGGTARPFEHLTDELTRSDIIISSTGSTHPIITQNMIEHVMMIRKNHPLIIIDIAVPRDVDPNAGKCPNCTLYDIDNLKEIVVRHLAHRECEVEKATVIIESEVVKYEKWISSLDAQKTIRDLFSLMDTYVGEQTNTLTLSERERLLFQQELQSSIRRLLHRPVSFLKDHPDIANIRHIRRIFRLDEDYQDRHKGEHTGSRSGRNRTLGN